MVLGYTCSNRPARVNYALRLLFAIDGVCTLCFHPGLAVKSLLFVGFRFQRPGSKQSTNPADNYHLARRRTLQVVVSSLLTEAGFESAEKASVETLTEMLQSCEYREPSFRNSHLKYCPPFLGRPRLTFRQKKKNRSL